MQAFKHKSSDQWLARLDNLAHPPDATEHLAHVAAEYGIAVEDIELVESATDPRTGTLIEPPDRPRTPEEEELSQMDTLIQACLDNTATAVQVRNLVGHMGQRMRRRGNL